MRIGRRHLILGTITNVGLASLLPGCSSDDGPPAPTDAGTPGPQLGPLPVDGATFAHGVASGDPLVDRVILWTRVTTADAAPVRVQWVVTSDPGLATVVASGEATASADADFTVKVDATGLAAGTTYFYAFAVEGKGRSVVGRTRTLPVGDVARLRLAMTSCANYNNGYFNAYARIAERADLDAWIHLGDYIYEYADGVYGAIASERPLVPAGEIVSLDDYRKRYAHYRSDADLQEIHRQHPIIAVWDDHETANDSWKGGAENHRPEQGDWEARKVAATRAFLEWLPVRVASADLPPKIWRAFSFGNLMDLLMLDTRLLGRDEQVGDTDPVSGTADKGTPEQWADPSRELLGQEQEAWLKNELTASKGRSTTWRFLGNQVIFSPTRDPRDRKPVTTDFWDGYQATRTRLFEHLASNAIGNLVILTGDIHTSWAMDVAPDPFDPAKYDPATGKGAVAVEIVGPSVTSLGLEGDPLASAAAGLLKGANPHLKFNEVTRKGYVLVDVTRERVQAEWYFVADHKTRTASEELAAIFACASGAPRLVAGDAATAPKPDAPPRAP